MFTVEARKRQVTDTGRVEYPDFLRTKPGAVCVGNGWYWMKRNGLNVPNPDKPRYSDSPLEYIISEVADQINTGFNVRVVSEEGTVVWQRYPE